MRRLYYLDAEMANAGRRRINVEAPRSLKAAWRERIWRRMRTARQERRRIGHTS